MKNFSLIVILFAVAAINMSCSNNNEAADPLASHIDHDRKTRR